MSGFSEHLVEGWHNHLHQTVHISEAERARIEALPYRGRAGRVKHWHRDKVEG